MKEVLFGIQIMKVKKVANLTRILKQLLHFGGEILKDRLELRVSLKKSLKKRVMNIFKKEEKDFKLEFYHLINRDLLILLKIFRKKKAH